MGNQREACWTANEELVFVFGENQAELVKISEIHSDGWRDWENEVLVKLIFFSNRSIVQLKSWTKLLATKTISSVLCNLPLIYPNAFAHLSLRKSPMNENRLFCSSGEANSGSVCWKPWNCNQQILSANESFEIKTFDIWMTFPWTYVATRVDHSKIVVKIAEHCVDLWHDLIVVGVNVTFSASQRVDWKLWELSALEERWCLAERHEVLKTIVN